MNIYHVKKQLENTFKTTWHFNSIYSALLWVPKQDFAAAEIAFIFSSEKFMKLNTGHYTNSFLTPKQVKTHIKLSDLRNFI